MKPRAAKPTLLCPALTILAGAASAQTISSYFPAAPTRSGLVRVYGSGFGSTGSILIAGRAAPLARWSDTLVEFYVPEETPLTPTKALLNTPTGRRAAFALDVQPRPVPTGRFTWRFQAADQYIITRPAIGPDGSVYVLGNFGHLYAIAPDGALQWVVQPSGGVAGCVEVGADGTIYCGGGGGVQAFSPSGVRLWQFGMKSSILAGPNIGPDGLIYAADNSRWHPSPTGAVVLTPNGQEVWSGGIFYKRGGPHQTEIQFDQNRAYIWGAGDATTGAPGGLTALNLGGGIDWNHGDAVGFQPGGYANGGVVAPGTSTIKKLDTSGNPLWAFSLWDIGGPQPRGDILPAPDGGAYFLTSNARLNAIGPTGNLRYSNTIGGILSNLTLSPDGSTILLQKGDNFGTPFRIEAYASNGAFRWRSEDLPMELGTAITIYNRMKFAPTGEVVYFGTSGPMLTNDTANCYVYAMDAR